MTVLEQQLTKLCVYAEVQGTSDLRGFVRMDNIIVIEEHQSHHTLRCFSSLIGGGFECFMT